MLASLCFQLVPNESKVEVIEKETFKELIEKNIQVIDVRTAEEMLYLQKHMHFHQLILNLQNLFKTLNLDKNKSYNHLLRIAVNKKMISISLHF